MMDEGTKRALESTNPGTTIELRERTTPLTVTAENITVNPGEEIALGLEGSRGGNLLTTPSTTTGRSSSSRSAPKTLTNGTEHLRELVRDGRHRQRE